MPSRLERQIQAMATRLATEITRAVGQGIAEELERLRAEQVPAVATKARRSTTKGRRARPPTAKKSRRRAAR